MEKGTHTFQVKATDENGSGATTSPNWPSGKHRPSMKRGGLIRSMRSLLAVSYCPSLSCSLKNPSRIQTQILPDRSWRLLSKPFAPCLLKVRLQNLFNRRKAIQNEFKKNTPVALISPMEFTSADEQLVRKAVKIKRAICLIRTSTYWHWHRNWACRVPHYPGKWKPYSDRLLWSSLKTSKCNMPATCWKTPQWLSRKW